MCLPSILHVIVDIDKLSGTFRRDSISSDHRVEQWIYAHRSRPTILVNQVEITRVGGGSQEVEVEISNNLGDDSEDMDLVTEDAEDLDGNTW